MCSQNFLYPIIPMKKEIEDLIKKNVWLEKQLLAERMKTWPVEEVEAPEYVPDERYIEVIVNIVKKKQRIMYALTLSLLFILDACIVYYVFLMK